jgi:hypothetical protein
MAHVIGESKEFVKQCTCRNCGAVIEYNQHEVKEKHGFDYSGGADGKQWIDCPRCSKEVILKAW